METGEKYLSIKVQGLPEYFVAFPNEEKQDLDQKPHYKGHGVAVWVKQKKPTPQKEGAVSAFDLKELSVLMSPEDYSFIMSQFSSKNVSEDALRRVGAIIIQSWRYYC